MKKGIGLALVRILALLVAIAISLYVYSIRDQADQIGVYGYPGIFLFSFLAYATVLLPAPALAVIFAMGAVFNPFAIALVAGAGAACGETVGYLAGFSSQVVVERTAIYKRIEKWMKVNGSLTIFVLSAIPNPVFDVAGAIAGAFKMPILRFLDLVLAGLMYKNADLRLLRENFLKITLEASL